MIVGVDHLAFSVSDLQAETPWLEMGYKVQFVERELENHKAKTHFLTHYVSEHGMLYLKHPAGVALEGTYHSPPASPASGSYYPVFSVSPSTLDGGECLPAVQCVFNKPVTDIRLSSSVHYGALQREGAGLTAVVVRTHDLSVSLDFWTRGLGFQIVRQEGKTIRLSNRALFPHWQIDVVLIEVSEPPGKGYLDATGFTCLALLSTNIENDSVGLFGRGACDMTAPFTLAVNSKPLRLLLLRSPGGAPVELIQT